MQEEVPIRFAAFDLLWLGGESLLDRPLRERRQALESLEPLPRFSIWRELLRRNRLTRSIRHFLLPGTGNEGLMIKDPGSFYTPGGAAGMAQT